MSRQSSKEKQSLNPKLGGTVTRPLFYLKIGEMFEEARGGRRGGRRMTSGLRKGKGKNSKDGTVHRALQ
jgi:hypothetical protein